SGGQGGQGASQAVAGDPHLLLSQERLYLLPKPLKQVGEAFVDQSPSVPGHGNEFDVVIGKPIPHAQGAGSPKSQDREPVSISEKAMRVVRPCDGLQWPQPFQRLDRSPPTLGEIQTLADLSQEKCIRDA